MHQAGSEEGVRIHAEKKRTLDSLRPPLVTNRLRHGKHMLFVETTVVRTAAMAGSAETDQLVRIAEIWLEQIVCGDQTLHIFQRFIRRLFSSPRMLSHVSSTQFIWDSEYPIPLID